MAAPWFETPGFARLLTMRRNSSLGVRRARAPILRSARAPSVPQGRIGVRASRRVRALARDERMTTKANTFSIDEREVDIREGETIFRAARRLGIKLPHLCYSPKPGYRPDGNCRVCMVEIEGERVLAARCIRTPTPGMKVKTQTHRAKTARRMVVELLLTDQPPKDVAHDPQSEFWLTADRQGVTTSRLPPRAAPRPPPTAATRRWRSISTPASSAISASAPAARCRSTT